jgi:hypothetical protein
MARRAASFASILLTALCLGPGLAHLLALPNKLRFSRDAYFTAQQVYRGWAWLGALIFAAIFATLVLAILERRRSEKSLGALAAFSCLVAAQAVFWIFTFPANQATRNWTFIPPDWIQLRLRWEYSHALGALLTLAALVVLVLSVTTRPPQAERGPAEKPL